MAIDTWCVKLAVQLTDSYMAAARSGVQKAATIRAWYVCRTRDIITKCSMQYSDSEDARPCVYVFK